MKLESISQSINFPHSFSTYFDFISRTKTGAIALERLKEYSDVYKINVQIGTNSSVFISTSYLNKKPFYEFNIFIDVSDNLFSPLAFKLSKLAIPSSSTRKNEIILYHMLLRCLNKLHGPHDHLIKMYKPAVNQLLCTKLEEEVIEEMDISENRFREEIG